jgi:hypothetical protein
MLHFKPKKLFLGICFFVFYISSSWAQTLGDYQSNAAIMSWNSTTQWNTWNGLAWVATATPPSAASGIITILSGHTVTINIVLSNSASIIVNSGGTLMTAAGKTFTNVAAGTVTVNGTLTNISTGIIINNGAILNNLTFTNTGTFTNNLTLNNATGATITHNGFAGATGFVNAAAGTITNIGTITINTGKTLTNSGVLSNSGTITLITTGILSHSATGTYKHNFSSLAAATGTIPTSTWNAASTCEIIACGNSGDRPVNLTQNYGNFKWSNITQPIDINLLGGLTSIAGNFTLNGTNGFNLNLVSTNAGGPTTVAGVFTLNGGNITILKVNAINKGNQLSVGTYVQSGGVMTIANCSGSFGGTNSTNGQLTVSGTSTITGGTINVNTGTWVGANGNGIFQSGGLITLTNAVINGNSSAALLSTGVAGTITATAGMTINAGGIVNLNTSTTSGGGGSTTFTAGGLITLSGGTINGSSGTVAGTTGCNSSIQANASLTINSGTINLTPGNITGGGGNGTLNVTPTLTIVGGTVNINSSTATAGTTGSNGTIAVTGNCAINTGASTINVTSSTTTGGGGNGTFTVSGTFMMSTGTLNLCSTSSAGTGNGLLDIEDACSFTGGTFNITSSTTTNFSSGKGTLNVGGNFTHTTIASAFSRTATLANANGTINIDGLINPQTIESTYGFTGTIVFNISQGGLAAVKATIPGGKTFIVNSGTTLNLNDNSANTGYDLQVVATGNLKVSGVMNVNDMATLDLLNYAIIDASTGSGSFNLIDDALLITKHSQGITTLPSGALGCIQVTGGRSYSSSGSYTFNGAAAQVTGNGLPPSLISPSVLTIANNSSILTSGVTLSQATSTTGTLTLTQGRFITSSALFTIEDGGICSTTGSISAFVDGPIKKVGFTAATPFIFPTGDLYNIIPASGYVVAVKWARIAITSSTTSTTDAFTAEYHKRDDPCSTNQVVSNTNGSGIDHVSYKEYWDLTRNFGTVTPQVKLYWETGSPSTSLGSAISSVPDLRVAECITSTWTNKTGVVTTTGSAAGPGTIVSTLATTFTTNVAMPFTFASATGVNPLPIEFLSFTGSAAIAGNQLNWSTASETNNDFFELERSSNGTEFSKIAFVEGNGTSTSIINYSYFDDAPSNSINYYRLKQFDFDGAFTYSNLIEIKRNATGNTSVSVFPNPSSDLVNIEASDNISSLLIYNMLGEIVFSTSTQRSLQFDPIAKGIYLLKAISFDGQETVTRFIRN